MKFHLQELDEPNGAEAISLSGALKKLPEVCQLLRVLCLRVENSRAHSWNINEGIKSFYATITS